MCIRRGEGKFLYPTDNKIVLYCIVIFCFIHTHTHTHTHKIRTHRNNNQEDKARMQNICKGSYIWQGNKQNQTNNHKHRKQQEWTRATQYSQHLHIFCNCSETFTIWFAKTKLLKKNRKRNFHRSGKKCALFILIPRAHIYRKNNSCHK